MQYSHEHPCVGVSQDIKYLQTAASGPFLSMKMDLLNARGLSGQSSKAYVWERKICSERV